MSTQQDATVNIHVNNQEAEEKVKELSARARQLRQEFADAVRIGDKGTIAKTEKELKKVNKELNNATLRAARIRDAMKHLSQATPKELHNTLKLINQELNSGAVKRGSKEWLAYQKQIKQVNAELRKIQAESRETESTLNRANNFISKWGNAIVGGMAAMAGVTMAGKQAVQAYADMDSAMANTQKFTGMAREDVERLNEEFKKMDTRTSREGLNELAQAAGRLGKNSVEDVMGFVRAGDIIGVAMDELGADAPQIISQLAGIFNLESELGTEKAMLSVGSAINTLSQNCAAGAPNLVDFASRLGAIANSTNMSMDEMLAFGALLDDQKVSVEKASTAMQGVITKMYADPATFAKKVGLNVQEFTDALKRSSTEGIMMFVDALSKMDSMQQAATLKDLGTAGAGVVQTFQTLAGKTDLLRQQMETSKQAFDEATSATEEFGVQNSTVQAELDKAKKGFNEMAVELGSHLYPVMRYAISGTSLLMRGMKTLIEFVIANKGALLTLTAAIVAYNIAANLAIIKTKAVAAAQAIAKGATMAWTIVTQGATVVTALFTGGLKKAAVEFRVFSALIKASPMGLLVGAITAVVGGLIALATRTNEAADAQKALNSVRSDAKEKMVEEKTQIDLLVAAANNEKLTLDERKKAVDKLNKIIPNYNAQLDKTTGKYRANKKALDEYLTSLAKKYELEGAKDYLLTIGKEIARLNIERAEVEKALADAKKRTSSSSTGGGTPTPQTSGGAYAPRSYHASIGNSAEIAALESKLKNIDSKITGETAKRNVIFNYYGNDLHKSAIAEPVINDPVVDNTTYYNRGGGSGGTGTSRDRATNKQTVAEKKAEDAKKKMADILKSREARAKELIGDVSSEYQGATSIDIEKNKVALSLGLKNYREYIEEKNRITADGITQQRIALEEAGLDNTVVYQKLLKEELKLRSEQSEELRKINLDELEKKKKTDEDTLTEMYLNPSSPIFQNETAYRQKLFELDVKFLQDKQKLYTKDSEEWLEIETEIQERLRADQLQKQQETADAYRHYQEEYGKASGSQREKMELDILDNLHKQGLITEEEYNKARNAIREKYRNEDREKERTVQSEYADMVVNLYDSFKKFFDELGQDGSNFWENLEGAATAAFALMSAGLQQYSAYVNAERDLELAKIEHHYDAEIEAAGKNTKKKEKLEKDKEAKIAEVKKKYNERAMKIEMANAVAQTALAAISAYASGSQVNVFMGPIAAALALAAGAVQIATIKKQHQAEAIGYYEGGFTGRALDNHKEVGVVHANEFVANHKAVANTRLRPLFNLLDSAQRNNTVGSLTAQDVSNALGQGRGVTARAEVANTTNEQVGTGLALVGATLSSAGDAIDRLNKRIDNGIETVMIMDGERGFARKYENYNKRIKNAKR
ncbi:MAG: phage tail tape measure protein [Muribaculaceae bacterium]|nr:phage tail tape measure protein [Muribaculaceae bacterium]